MLELRKAQRVCELARRQYLTMMNTVLDQAVYLRHLDNMVAVRLQDFQNAKKGLHEDFDCLLDRDDIEEVKESDPDTVHELKIAFNDLSMFELGNACI